MGFGGAPREEEEDTMQIGVQEKGSSIKKRGRKAQGSPNSKGLFIAKRG
jgi:hypothetical protein